MYNSLKKTCYLFNFSTLTCNHKNITFSVSYLDCCWWQFHGYCLLVSTKHPNPVLLSEESSFWLEYFHRCMWRVRAMQHSSSCKDCKYKDSEQEGKVILLILQRSFHKKPLHCWWSSRSVLQSCRSHDHMTLILMRGREISGIFSLYGGFTALSITSFGGEKRKYKASPFYSD